MTLAATPAWRQALLWGRRWQRRARGWAPRPLAAGPREVWLGSVGAGLGLLLAEAFSHWSLGELNPWFIAPMGASAVLLFGVPASPLAQPWSIVGGNLVSALVGVACHQALGANGWAVAAAEALAVGAMFVLRCVHPPGGAVALTAVLGGPAIARLGFGFAVAPVAVNSLCVLALAWAFHRLAGRSYPHRPPAAAHPHRTDDPVPSARLGVSAQDVEAALASFGEPLDIDRDDLEEVLVRAQLHASRRHWAGVRCEDVMSRDVQTVGPDDSVDEAWARLARHRVKALPVVEADGRLVGIVSLHDFFIGQSAPVPTRVPRLQSARWVRDIMTRPVRHARPEQLLADLVRHFADEGWHHLPVVDDGARVVGIVTQSDVLMALYTGVGQAGQH